MKKIAIVILALLLSVDAFAQKKGDKFIGGNFGFSLKNNEVGPAKLATLSLSLRPNFEYFFVDNWSAITYLTLAREQEKAHVAETDAKQDFSSTLYGLSLGVIRYFPIGESLQFYAELDLLSETGPFKKDYNDPDDHSNNINSKGNLVNVGANMTFGLCVDFTPKYSIFIELGVLSYKYTMENPNGGSRKTSNNFDFLGNKNVMMIGISYLLP